MDFSKKIVVTGSAGFIASFLAQALNKEGYENLILVDDFSPDAKRSNWETLAFDTCIDREAFLPWFSENAAEIAFVFHLGARTNTTEKSQEILDHLNLHYSQEIWRICTQASIPLVYASSAATYGLGEFGYKDEHALSEKLHPLNLYGHSKNDFDIWALGQENQPPHWYGLKFFNVYGPNEYHKGRMASVVLHTFYQIKANGHMNLFRSHNPNYKDGEQLRDFVYVKDVVNVCQFLMAQLPQDGIYNLGSGKARTFYDLARLTFEAMELEPQIDFIDTPIDIRDNYQYFTEADMSKLREQGYSTPFYSLEEGVTDYVKNYLLPHA
jgi:ADP-L-glycero-D-manno-heptose 6-epimerase